MINIPNNKYIINHKLFFIRKLSSKDINSTYHSWFFNDNAEYIESRSKFKTLNNLKKYFNLTKSKKNILFLGIFTKYYKEHIGNIKFEFPKKNKYATLGIFIGNKKYLNQGYGKKIIKLSCYKIKNDFKIKTFYLGVNKNNLRAFKAYKKLGFKLVSNNYTKEIYKMKWIIN